MPSCRGLGGRESRGRKERKGGHGLTKLDLTIVGCKQALSPERGCDRLLEGHISEASPAQLNYHFEHLWGVAKGLGNLE
jgi:hypothetical protein